MVDQFPKRVSERRALIKQVKEARNRVKKPQSLLFLSVQAFADICPVYIDLPPEESPIGILPDAVIQIFLGLIAETHGTEKPIIPDYCKLEMLQFILNENVKTVDCSMMDCLQNLNGFALHIWEHALQHCPKIESISFKDLRVVGQLIQVPVLQLKQAWDNLRSLQLRNYFCSDDTMKLLQENFPNMESMEFNLNANTFTMTGVNHMAKMTKLKFFETTAIMLSKFPELVAHIAGLVPNLEVFHFSQQDVRHDNSFVESFGELYPEKKITVLRLRIKKGLKQPLSQNLQTRQLHLIGVLDANIAELLGSIANGEDLLEYLIFDSVDEASIKNVLEKIGHCVEKLQFTPIIADARRRFFEFPTQSSLDIAKAIIRCSKLKSLEINDEALEIILSSPETEMLTPHTFRKMKKFEYEKMHQLSQFHELFLLGAEHIENLRIDGLEQLQTLKNCSSRAPGLKKVKTLNIELNLRDVTFIPALEEGETLIECIARMMATIVCNAPCLEKIISDENVMESDNIYINFIKAVDSKLISSARGVRFLDLL